jgi:hypothetical protein
VTSKVIGGRVLAADPRHRHHLQDWFTACNVPIASAPIASVWASAVQTTPGDGPGHEAHGKEAEEDVLHVHVDVPRV